MPCIWKPEEKNVVTAMVLLPKNKGDMVPLTNTKEFDLRIVAAATILPLNWFNGAYPIKIITMHI